MGLTYSTKSTNRSIRAVDLILNAVLIAIYANSFYESNDDEWHVIPVAFILATIPNELELILLIE
jgi:uncharacterized membrane protein